MAFVEPTKFTWVVDPKTAKRTKKGSFNTSKHAYKSDALIWNRLTGWSKP
jgi:hypothetical protein